MSHAITITPTAASHLPEDAAPERPALDAAASAGGQNNATPAIYVAASGGGLSAETTQGQARGGRAVDGNARLLRLDQMQNKEAPLHAVTDYLRSHVLEHGTLQELRFVGEGQSKHFEFGRERVHLTDVLRVIGTLQQELGIKITEKIVFGGCNAFASLLPSEVDICRTLSVELGTQIIGATHFFNQTPGFQLGDHVAFTNGQVSRYQEGALKDGVLSPIGYAVVNVIAHGVLGLPKPDRSWIDCHVGKSQQDGEQCQQQHEAQVRLRQRVADDTLELRWRYLNFR